MKKKELLEKLYALDCGINYYNNLKNSINNINDYISNLNNSKVYNQELIKDIEKKLSVEGQLYFLKNYLYNRYQSSETKKLYYEKSKIKDPKPWYKKIKSKVKVYGILFLLSFFWGIGLWILLLLFFIDFVKKQLKNNERNNIQKQIDVEVLKEKRQFMDFLNTSFNEYLKKLLADKQKKENENKDIEQQLLKSNEELLLLTSSSDIFFENLKNVFGSFLFPEDWYKVPYLIYLIEKKRADSLKEALQLSDAHDDNERIEMLIEESKEHISTEIGDLGRKMGKAFVSVAEIITEQNRTLVNKINSLEKSTIKALSVVSQELNMALLEYQQKNQDESEKAKKILRDSQYTLEQIKNIEDQKLDIQRSLYYRFS